MRYARVQDGVVAEVLEIDDAIALKDIFPPDVAKAIIAAAADVAEGWLYKSKTFSAPPGPSLDDRKSDRIAALTALCASTIIGGYQSSALGSPHEYPSKNTAEHPDQLNMMGSVTNSLLPNLPDDWATPFWCADSDGVWAYRMHSAVQIRQAGSDGKAHVVACQTTLAQLAVAVATASTEAELDAVVWPSAA